MELKEYLQIIKKYKSLFAGMILIVVPAVFIYFSLKPISYSTSLTLDITRSGSQATQDYKFDDFYRLQADEKFAETLVQWLKSPSVVSQIYQNAGINNSNASLRNLSGLFKAEKLSSQIVAVSFSADNVEESQKISQSISKVLNENAEKLNFEQKQDNWFKIKSQNPVVVRDKTNTVITLLASLSAGIFLGFWGVLIKHYLE